jgi:cytochrome c-type biogenesis protein CcsB
MDELKLLWIALVIYVVTGCIAIFSVALDKRADRTVLGLLVAALMLHTVAIGLRWERLGHGPYVTMFEILSSNIWSLSLVFAIAYWRMPKVRPIAAVVMPILFMMMGWMMLMDRTPGPLPATYHTIWLFIHIGFSKVFLGAVLVAVGLAAVVLLREAGRGQRFARLPESSRLDELAYRWMALGLVFNTLMLISGAIWAQDAWGRYWAWDPLETWAFITWLSLAIAMHARFTLKLTPRTGAVIVIAVFVSAFFTFFGIPFVNDVPHKGAV